MKLIAWSLDHPRAILMGALLSLTLALLSLAWLIPTRLVPNLQSPFLAVLARCPNLTAEQVESQFTIPLEHHLSPLSQIRSLRSQSMPGLALVILEYPYHHSQTQAPLRRAELQARLAAFPGRPSEHPCSWEVVAYDPLDLPVLNLAVWSPQRDPGQLRQLLQSQTLLWRQIPGVDRVVLFGARPQIDVRPLKQNSPIPLGRVGSVGTTFPDQELRKALIQVQTWQQLQSLQIAGRPLSGWVSVSWSLGHDSPRYRYNGRDCLEIKIYQQPSASSPHLVYALRQAIKQVQTQHPDLQIDEAYNNAHFVEVVQANVWLELGLAIGLTGLVVYLFLGDLRGTLIALACLPTSLALALLAFVPLEMSLNSSTLIGLLLALGRIVDDTIIDLHAIGSHLCQGKSAREAALAGCSEVRPAVISSTLIMGLAILPLTWCGGLTQDMFTGIVWAYLLALGASLLVSLTLTPVLAGWAYQRVRLKSHHRLENAYRAILRKCLKFPGWLLGATLALTYLAWLLFPMIGSEMMPSSDTGQMFVEMEAPNGSSSQQTAALAANLEEVLRRQPEVLKVSSEVGMDRQASHFNGYDLGSTHSARMLVTLSDQSQRKRSLWEIADRVQAEARKAVPGLRRLVLKEMGSDVMASSMAPIEVVLYGPNLKRLAWLGEQARQLGSQLRGLSMVSTSWNLSRAPEDPYREAEGSGQWLTNLEQDIPLILHDQVPLKSPFSMIEHDNLQRSLSVTGSLRRGGPGSMKLAMDLQMACQSQLAFPQGYGIKQRGDMIQMMDSFERLLQSLATALLLIFLALAWQFRGWRIPLLILVAIPLELSGVFLALLLTGHSFSSVSLLGIVVLHGMDLTASILLLDSVQRCRQQDSSLEQALLEGTSRRLRPILMTVAVTLAVMLPLALAPRTGLDAYAPLAAVIVGGLSLSGALTLLVIPTLYSLIQGGIHHRTAESPRPVTG